MQRASHSGRSNVVRSHLIWTLILSLSVAPTLQQQAAAEELICVSVGTKRYIGDPLFMSQSQILLLLRDGRLRELPGTSEAQVQRVGDRFEPYTHQQVRSRLSREFGSNFEISVTRDYVVVHPVGEGHRWTVQFEELYANFVHYFAVRGWEPAEPKVPLVAIVLHDRREFLDYAESRKDSIDPSVIGYYSSHSNRIALYDAGSQATAENLSTIYHEAAHQTAFNIGVHHRFTPPPRWAAEGLGTLFETPAVWSANTYATRDGRINQRMLREFQRQVGNQADRIDLARLIESDDWFSTDPSGAYARAWAVSYYLSETRPYQYVEYLKRTAAKQPFQRVSSEERWADWNAVFSDDLRSLEMHILQHLGQFQAN